MHFPWKTWTGSGSLSLCLTTRRRMKRQRWNPPSFWFMLIPWAQGTEDTELTLTREGDYIVSTDDNVEEINIFEGQFNRITFEQVYTKTFKCTYQLQLYPFDTQVSAQEKDQWGCPRCVRWTWWWGSWRPRWCRSHQTSSPWSQRRCSPSIWSPTGRWLTTMPATWTLGFRWRSF